jgi:hypothetical protein
MVDYPGLIKLSCQSFLGLVNTPKTHPKCATIFIVIMEEHPAPLAFNEWLKRRRKACDLTQDELPGAQAPVAPGRSIGGADLQNCQAVGGALEIPKEDQDTFIRLARGELNLERLERFSTETPAVLPGVALIQPAQSAAYLGNSPALPSNRLPLQATALIGREAELSIGRLHRGACSR